jgi:hypothetical protein
MQKEIVDVALHNLKGGTFVGMDTETVPTLKGGKKNPMQGRVRKLMTGATVMMFSNAETNAYEAMVQRRLQREGKDAKDFQLSPRAWGRRVAGTAYVEHKGKWYVEAIFLHSGLVQYTLDGKPIDKTQIEGLEDADVNPQAQGGLDNKVVLRTFALDSLVALRVNGREWSSSRIPMPR